MPPPPSRRPPGGVRSSYRPPPAGQTLTDFNAASIPRQNSANLVSAANARLITPGLRSAASAPGQFRSDIVGARPLLAASRPTFITTRPQLANLSVGTVTRPLGTTSALGVGSAPNARLTLATVMGGDNVLLTATAPPAGGAGRAWPANSLTFVNQSRPPQFVQQRPLGEGIRVATRGRPRLLTVNAVGGAAAGVNGGVAYMGGLKSITITA